MKKANPESVLTKHLARRVVAKLPFTINQEAMAAEAGDRLKRIYDPAKLAKEIVKLKSFKKMVGRSVDMVKDALIALERKGVIRQFDDDMFFELRDEVEILMKFRKRAHTRRVVARQHAGDDLFNALLDAEKALMKLIDVQPSSKKDSATLSRSIAKVQKALQAIDREMSTINGIAGKVNG